MTSQVVIHSQFGPVSTEWSVSYRFAVGAISMFVVALKMRLPIRMRASDHALAAVLGLVIFAVNYNAVYASELHITSGLVAVMFSLLVPFNAVLRFRALKARRRPLPTEPIFVPGRMNVVAYPDGYTLDQIGPEGKSANV